MPESVDINKIVEKIKASVGEDGYVLVDITGYNKKEFNEKGIKGFHLKANVYQDSEEFDYSKSTDVLSSSGAGNETLHLSYDKDGIAYSTSLPLSELPKYFPIIIKSPAAGKLREYVSKKLEDLKREVEYRRDDFEKHETELKTFAGLAKLAVSE